MELKAGIHSQAPGQPPGVQSKRVRREYKNKEGQGYDEEIYKDSCTNFIENHEP